MSDIPEMHSLEMLRADNAGLRHEMATNMIYKKEADELRAEIERLRLLPKTLEDDKAELRAELEAQWDIAAKLRAEIERLRADNDRLIRLLDDREIAFGEIERLRAALRRIDGINDNPACYNPMIDEVLRAALAGKEG